MERSPDLVAVRSGAAGGGEGGLPLRNGQPPPETPPGGEPDRPRTTWVAVLAGLLIPAGLGVVMVADRVAYGDALAFSHTQAAHWGRHLAWPWAAPIAAMGNPGPAFTEIWAHNLLELATVAFAAVMLVLGMVGPWRLRRDQAVFVLLGWALLLFMISFPSRYTEDIPYPLYSASRIGMEIFPAFMVLSRMGRIERGVLAAFLMVQGLLAAHFLHSGWVA